MGRTALFSRTQPGGVFTIADLPAHPGEIFFVGSSVSGAADSAGAGRNPDYPFATLDYAVGQCTAAAGDVIYILPGHSETYTTTGTKLTADIAGISIIGLGNGADRPTFTYSHADATWSVTAAGVTMKNLLFVTGVDSVVTFMTVAVADFSLLDCEIRDTTDVEALNGITTTAAADRLLIDGLFYNGYTGGDACARGLNIVGCNVGVIRNCRFQGLASTAFVNFLTTASTKMVIEGCTFLNTGTALTKNIVATIGGCTWEARDCFDAVGGYGFSGGSGAALAADDVSAVAALIGTPVNAGGTATLGAVLGDMANVSVATRLTNVLSAVAKSGAFAWGVCDAGMAGSTTVIVSDDLAGYGADFFNGNYFLQVLFNANSATNAPEDEVRQITDYATATGTFTCTAFSQNVETGDYILILHESMVMIGRDDANNTASTTNVVANATGSILERQQYAQGQLNKLDAATLAVAPVAGSLGRFIASGGTALGTQLGDSKSIIDALGTNGVVAAAATAATAVSLFGAIGTNEVDATTPFTSAAVQANGDGTVLEREEYIQAQVNKLDGVTLAVAPTAASLASFVASGGVALGTQLPTSTSLVDLVGAYTGPVGGAVADDNIKAHLDLVKAATDKIDTATLAVAPAAGSLGRFVASGGTALGTQLPDSKSLYDMVRDYGRGYMVSKEITYSGGVLYSAFTVTGLCAVKVLGYITTALTNHGDATSVGTVTSAAGLIAATAGTAMQTVNQVWVDNAPSKFEGFPANHSLLGDGEDIAVVGTANLAGGVVTLYCWYFPVSTGASVVAA